MNADIHSSNLADLLEQVKAGQEITLTENGEPVALLVQTPNQQNNIPSTLKIQSGDADGMDVALPQSRTKKSGPKKRIPGSMPGIIISDDFDDPLPDDFVFPWGLAKE